MASWTGLDWTAGSDGLAPKSKASACSLLLTLLPISSARSQFLYVPSAQVSKLCPPSVSSHIPIEQGETVI